MLDGARYCFACGARVGGGGTNPSRIIPWAVAGISGVLLLILLLLPRARVAAPAVRPVPSTTPSGALPDLSAMAPAERFDRLYQRIIGAAQSGDQGTVTRFMPMAVAAFGMLDTVTVNARYQLAMLQLHVGDLAAAESQADSIRRADPDHLFSYVIRAAVARWKQDDKARAAAYGEILQRYDREMAKRKPEYLEHQSMLEEVRRTAAAEPTARKAPS